MVAVPSLSLEKTHVMFLFNLASTCKEEGTETGKKNCLEDLPVLRRVEFALGSSNGTEMRVSCSMVSYICHS